MTSNLGAEALVHDVNQDGEVSPRAKENVFEAVRRTFAPEFVNRIDEMVKCLSLYNQTPHYIIKTMKSRIFKLIRVFFLITIKL
jgi:ATP-dependent Clp protease ATP-binding subunit ClpA